MNTEKSLPYFVIFKFFFSKIRPKLINIIYKNSLSDVLNSLFSYSHRLNRPRLIFMIPSTKLCSYKYAWKLLASSRVAWNRSHVLHLKQLMWATHILRRHIIVCLSLSRPIRQQRNGKKTWLPFHEVVF